MEVYRGFYQGGVVWKHHSSIAIACAHHCYHGQKKAHKRAQKLIIKKRMRHKFTFMEQSLVKKMAF